MLKHLGSMACGMLLLGIWSLPARAQVWIDASQLGERVPDWVDAKMYQPTPQTIYPSYPTPAPPISPPIMPPPRIDRIWIEPIYRPIRKRVWVEPVYQTICEQTWVEGHYESRPAPMYGDPCNCPPIHTERVWVPGHYISTQRQICIAPGHWEIVDTRECISSGHWESIGILRDGEVR